MNIKLANKEKIKLTSPDDVYDVMRNILLREQKLDRDKEHFWMIGLASNSRILSIELVSMGSVNSSTVEPMNVFRFAVMKGAVAVIMVHNHPSGELKPSESDKDLTDRMIQVGHILNIRVFDHLIISAKSFLSFANIGLFQELEQSTKYVPQFELIERIQNEEKRIREQDVMIAEKKAKQEGKKEGKIEGKAEGKTEKAIEMAREMKTDNEPIEKIIKF